MKVVITRSDKLVGIIFRERQFYARFDLYFTEDEMEALKKSGADRFPINPRNDDTVTTIGSLKTLSAVMGLHRWFRLVDTDSASLARREQETKENLEGVKAIIENVYTTQGSEEYEL